MRINVQEVRDEVWQEKIRSYFAEGIAQLHHLGFAEEFYIEEVMPPLSRLFAFPSISHSQSLGTMYRFGGFFQAMEQGIMLVGADGYVCGSPSKVFGVRYCTRFQDGTLLFTVPASKDAKINSQPAKKFFCIRSNTTDPAVSLDDHLKGVQKLADEGRQVIAPLRTKDLLWICARLDTIFIGEEATYEGANKKKKLD